MALRKVVFVWFCCFGFFYLIDAVSTNHFVWLTILNMYVLSRGGEGEPACINRICSKFIQRIRVKICCFI